MFEEESSEQPKKKELPKISNTESASSGWLKKVSQLFSVFKKESNDHDRNKKIHQLEKARDTEKKILLEQRNFYEKLFSRSPETKNKTKHHFFEKLRKAPKPALTPPPPPSPPASVLSVPTPKAPEITIPTQTKVPEPSALVLKPPVALTMENEIPKPPLQSQPQITQAPVQSSEITKPPLPVAPLPVQKKAFSLGFFSRLFSKDLSAKLAEERKKEEAWQERNSVEQRFWQPAKGFNPNLIKDQEIVFFNWHENILVLSLSLVMCCLAISLTYVGLLIWQKERLEASKFAFSNVEIIDSQIKKSEQEVEEVKEFNNKLSMVSGLLDNHVYWTNFLTFLEDSTLKDVYYERFAGDISGEYSIPALASSLEAISLQLDVMKKVEKVESVSPDIGQPSADGRSMQFNLGLVIDPTVFTKK